MAAFRKIVEHPDYTAARRALDINSLRLDEILEGAIDVIAHDPQEFSRVDHTTKLYSLATRDWASSDAPRFIIYFSFDDETVTLEFIHREEVSDRY